MRHPRGLPVSTRGAASALQLAAAVRISSSQEQFLFGVKTSTWAAQIGRLKSRIQLSVFDAAKLARAQFSSHPTTPEMGAGSRRQALRRDVRNVHRRAALNRQIAREATGSRTQTGALRWRRRWTSHSLEHFECEVDVETEVPSQTPIFFGELARVFLLDPLATCGCGFATPPHMDRGARDAFQRVVGKDAVRSSQRGAAPRGQGG
eukprot:gene17996-biopygen17374